MYICVYASIIKINVDKAVLTNIIMFYLFIFPVTDLYNFVTTPCLAWQFIEPSTIIAEL